VTTRVARSRKRPNGDHDDDVPEVFEQAQLTFWTCPWILSPPLAWSGRLSSASEVAESGSEKVEEKICYVFEKKCFSILIFFSIYCKVFYAVKYMLKFIKKENTSYWDSSITYHDTNTGTHPPKWFLLSIRIKYE